MLLTISTTHQPATDLGYLLHKHPDRCQSFALTFGQAHVFYPEVSADRATAALLLDVDPVAMVRGKNRDQGFALAQYVNDRPYVASSFLSVAIAEVFSSAMAGRCKDRPELVDTPIPLSARIDVLPVRAVEGFAQRVFEPLGYTVETVRHPLDEQFADWGESPYHSLTIRGTKTLSELLTQLYVLIPVFDNQKHYFIGQDEIEKLLSKGAGWLAAHPEKDFITRRYLGHRTSLFRQALSRLVDEDGDDSLDDTDVAVAVEETLETTISLNQRRHGTVLAALRASGAKSVLDLGCGEGKLLRELLADRRFERIVGVDVSIRSLEKAQQRLKLERLPESQVDRLKLLHGSLMYRDERFAGFDAAAVVEVIEHLDPPRLAAFERVVFEFARPQTVVLTTPNQEYNSLWETLPAGAFRHSDHRFEWSRAEFEAWGNRVATQHQYTVRFAPVGPEHESLGAPTQMATFERSPANATA
ncbi:MAG: 3' terminal RNA ribose 2'-O-methyltransferase Hen1 [Planctomycetota bacterium]|nr:3' terminal RNA ribose 2'-O-methyltransferase Hen1 [Planctomycetota bacterium]